MLTRYGTDVLIGVAIAVIILIGIAIWTDELWAKILFLLIAGFLTVFSLNFFRDPDRVARKGDGSGDDIISPADGKVVLITEVDEPEYLQSKAKLISIFMSPLDVHVNRIPVPGVIEHLRYVKGKFLIASTPESVNENERMMIGINSSGRRLLFNQVTGYVARRIVCTLALGDSVRAGDRFGMIKFGSRVDIYLPPGAKLLVKEGDITKSGETLIAQWQKNQ
ncbi:MAG: phosphatidylserine decarboxylase family protein [Ignavibacteriota bacterium]